MVFISYSSVEYATALQIRSALESNSIDCWMAPESIPPVSDYADEIQGAIEGSDIFYLCFLSLRKNPSGFAKSWTKL